MPQPFDSLCLTAYVIAQQYSSASFVSPRLHSPQEEIRRAIQKRYFSISLVLKLRNLKKKCQSGSVANINYPIVFNL
jgi:hypothetical protein